MTPIALTETERKALAILLKSGPITCSHLGSELYQADNPRRLTVQAFARPGGRVIASLRRKGLVKPGPRDKFRFLYLITQLGIETGNKLETGAEPATPQRGIRHGS